MKISIFSLATLLTCGTSAAEGKWNITEHSGKANIGYVWDKGTPSTEGLAPLLAARNKDIPLNVVTFGGYFNHDQTIQNELLIEFKRRYPELLQNALRSSGNRHNPKVLPLRYKFSECLLHTPTLTRINEALRGHGYSIARADLEQFWINKDEKDPTFFSIVVLVVEPSGDKGKEAEQPGAAQPATQPADKPPVKDQPPTPTSKDAPR